MEIETIKLHLPFSPDHVYLYLVDSEFLIDGGPLFSEKTSQLRPKALLVTHHHIDHVGALFKINAVAYMHPIERELLSVYTKTEEYLKKNFEICKTFGISPRYLDPVKALSNLKLDVKARFSEETFGFKSLEVPGHTPAHICYWRDNVLFSGDAILSETTPNVCFSYITQSILRRYLQALERIKGSVEVIYPAHERKINDVDGRIEELIDHYLGRTKEVLEIMENRTISVEEVAREIRWSQGRFEDLSSLDKYLAIMETLAYLEYLEEQETVKRVLDDFIKFRRI